MNNVIFLLDYAPKAWSTREEFHLRFCEALRDCGSQAVLLFSEDLPREIHARFEESGAAIHTLSYGDGANEYFRCVGSLVRRYSISLAHIRFFDYFSPVAWMARLHGVRRVVFTESNGGELNARGWRLAAVRSRTRVMTWPYSRFIAISDFISQRMEDVGVPRDKIVRIYNGVDLERFAPQPEVSAGVRASLGIARDDLVLVTASALIELKHTEIILEACARLAARGLPVRLLVAGTGRKKEEWEELARRLGIGARVSWLGQRNDIDRLYQATDIFVLASVGEAFGNVLAEAMGCNLPVVASASGGMKEIVVDGRTGFLVPPLDAGALADAVGRLAADPDLRRQMGCAGRRRAEAEFSVDSTVERTMRVYESLWSSVG